MSFEVFENWKQKYSRRLIPSPWQMEIEELKDKTILCRRKFRLPPATTKRWCAKPTAERRTDVWQDRLARLLGKMEEV